MFYFYILKSNTNIKCRYYIGHTKDIEKRVKEHNSKPVRSTKAFIPWKAVYTETFNSKSEAFKREQQIKSYKSGEAFKKLFENSESWQSG
ncbi:MAG: GIY-YIG nuclease family protein [Ignavibacteriaceae bacterium]|jgi:putative endonuclease